MPNGSGSMAIRAIEVSPVYIPFKRSHRISLGLSEGRSILLVKVLTDQGLQGAGEAVAHPAFSGESLGTLKSVVDFLRDCVIGENPVNIHRIMARMDRSLYGNYGAKAAIEAALFDIVGKSCGLPVYDLLGGSHFDKMALSRSASQSDVKRDVAEVRQFMADGYRIIKVKVGILPVKADIERVRAIRDAVGPAVSLRVDANQGWSVAQTMEFVAGVSGCNLSFVEQPIPKWNLDGLAFLKRHCPFPIAADEAVTTEHDMLQIVRKDGADVVSIKVIKSGGILKSQRVATVAESAGITCYLGSQCETSVGTAASLHFATATSQFDYGGEIYGPEFFVTDVVKKSVRIENGFIYPSSDPGLGVELDDDIVRELTVKV